MSKILAFLGVLVVLLVSGVAHAHGMRSGYVEISEADEITLRLRTTQRGTGFAVTAPSGCRFADGSTRLAPASDALLAHGVLRCEGALAGRSLAIEGLGAGLEEVVVVYDAHGVQRNALLRGETRSYDFPGAEGAPKNPLAAYVRLGFVHIASGVDHLAFLLLLVLTLRKLRPILVAETAFTISHCVSFSLTATGLVRVPASPTEVLIALSILLMAFDVPRAGSKAPSSRAVAAIAFVFGAVHGLGFAGGLREIGLPDHDVAWALVGFAGGVEVGQVAFIAALLALGWLGARLLARFGTSMGARLERISRESLVVVAGGYASLLVAIRLTTIFAH